MRGLGVSNPKDPIGGLKGGPPCGFLLGELPPCEFPSYPPYGGW